MTVSLLLFLYASSSASSLALSRLCLSISRSSLRSLRPWSYIPRWAARSFDALPGVRPASGIVLFIGGDLWIDLNCTLGEGIAVGGGPSKIDFRRSRSFARSESRTVTGLPAAVEPLPGGGKRAKAAHAKADMVGRRAVLSVAAIAVGGLPLVRFPPLVAGAERLVEWEGTVREGRSAKAGALGRVRGMKLLIAGRRDCCCEATRRTAPVRIDLRMDQRLFANEQHIGLTPLHTVGDLQLSVTLAESAWGYPG